MSEAGVDSALDKVLAMAGPLLPVWGTVVPWLSPLIDQLDRVVGDAAAVHETAAGWRSMGVEVNQIVVGQWELQGPLDQGWAGAAADGYRSLALDLTAEAQRLAADLGRLGDYLDAAAAAVAETEAMVLDVIRELIEFLIVTVLSGLLISAVSAGAGALAAGLAAAAESTMAGIRVAALLERVAQTLTEIAALVERLRTARDLTLAERGQKLAMKMAASQTVKHTTGLTGNPFGVR